MEALKIFFQNDNRIPRTIRFDQGGEFKSEVKKYLTKRGINVFYTLNSCIKASYAERSIRNIKNRLYSYFMENNTYKYIDVLQKIVDSYNNTPHQSLGGATPASVTKANEDEIRYIQYLVRQKRSKNVMNKTEIKMTSKKSSKKKKRIFYKFKVGDLVRISHLRRVFEKGYQEKWTLEYFKISKRFKREDKDIYKITDILGDPIL